MFGNNERVAIRNLREGTGHPIPFKALAIGFAVFCLWLAFAYFMGWDLP